MQTMKPTRRTFLLTAAAGALSATGAGAIAQTANGAAARSKALVIYFSRTGTTRQLAQMIGRAVGAPLLELTLREPYAQEYGAMTDIARAERASGARREIATTIPDLSGYDTIYLGSPYWWGGISIPVRTFLQDHPLAGKRVVPFVVSASSSPEGAWADIKESCPQAQITAGFHTVESQASRSLPQITHWLRDLGVV